MTPQSKDLMLFLDKLPTAALDALSENNIDIFFLANDIPASHGLVLYETGNICEGVRRVLSGEDSPSNFKAFVSQDPNIEEDNRPKIPELSYEIQQKIFDPVLPILKEASYPIKEGRVPEPLGAPVPIIKRGEPADAALPPAPPPHASPTRPPPPPALFRGTRGAPAAEARAAGGAAPLGEAATASGGGIPPAAGAPLDERHLRALLRIASGTEHSEQELRERFEDLPDGLKRAITSVDTANALQEIAKKHLLHVDQMGALASETGLVLLGITHPVYFVSNLTTRLRLPQQKALEIARDVSSQILAKVKDALRNLHENGRTRADNQTSITKQAPSPNTQTQVNPAEQPTSPSTTPYSKEAAWDTGQSQSVIQSKARLERQTPPPPAYTKETARGAEQAGSRPGQVGPTGWRPAPQRDRTSTYPPPITTRTPSPAPKTDARQSPAIPKPVTPAKAEAPPPPVPPEPARQRTVFSPRPSTAPAPAPPPPRPAEPAESDDFLSEKLQKPARLESETERYTVDPYREPPE